MPTADTDTLTAQFIDYAQEQGLNVTWEDVRNEFSGDLEDVYDYKQRRIRIRFENWLTRQRVR